MADAPVSFATHGDDLDLEILLRLLADRFDIVADEADGAGAEDCDALRLEYGVSLSDGCRQLFLCTKDDVGLLDIRAQTVARVAVPALFRLHEIAARSPGEVGAADGAVGDVQDIFDRTEDNSLGAGVGAAAVGQNARDAAVIGLDLLFDLAGVLDDHVLFSDIPGFFGNARHHSFDCLAAPGNGYRLSLDSAHDMATLPLSPVLILTASSTGQTKIRPSP